MENKYQRGKIHKIVDVGYNKCYFGSTIEKLLSNRMSRHRSTYKNYLSDKLKTRVTSFDLFDEYSIENCKIELFENYPCSSKQELEAREGHYIRTTDCVNKHIMGRTKEQWTKDNEERLKDLKKKWQEDNKEHIKDLKQQNYQRDKKRIKDKCKEYYEKKIRTPYSKE
jgi:hypothetical protein